ncbi:MAG: hypothetical protein AAF479_01340 [Pseudomonadota bacterium]
MYVYEKRYEMLLEQNNLFEKLRESQIRAKAILNDKEINRLIDELFSLRIDIKLAIEHVHLAANRFDIKAFAHRDSGELLCVDKLTAGSQT